MKYWLETIQPSIQNVRLTAEDLAPVKSPVLAIHGTKDRSAPYGGGRDWALMLPNARLLTIEGVAHAPWIEAPEGVLGPIQTFLDGAWPEAAQQSSPNDLGQNLPSGFISAQPEIPVSFRMRLKFWSAGEPASKTSLPPQR